MFARRLYLAAVLVLAPAFTPGGTAVAQEPDCPSCFTYEVLVIPPFSSIARMLGGTYTDSFTVSNVGTGSDTYTMTCTLTGGLTNCTASPSPLAITAGTSKKVGVTYTVGAPGGTVTLTATSINTSDQNSFTVTANPTLTWVVPKRTGTRAVVATRQPVIRALFLPNGSGIDTTKTVLVWKHGTSTDTVSKFKGDSLSVPRHNRGLIEWEVDSIRWLNGRPDSALAKITVCALNTLCTTDSAWAVLPNDSTPILGFTGRPLEALGRQFSAPFGPGLSVSGAEVETGFGIPAYISMGLGRRAGLVYSTRTSYPRALVPIDLELPWPATAPTQIKLILFDGAVKLDSVVLTSGQTTCASYGGVVKRCRAVLQGDFSATGVGITRKWLVVEASVTSSSITKIISDSTEVVLVDRRATMYGSGWWPSGFLKMVAAGSDRLLVAPNGTAAVYRGNGDSVYLSPPGDFTALVKVGSGWELRPRGTLGKVVFNANGRFQAGVDPSGNRDSIAYGVGDSIAKFVDPVGKTITLAYDGNGKLSTFTDPGSRQSKVSINSGTNQLTYDSVSSPGSRAYLTTFVYQTYPGTNTVVLLKRIGVITDTTIVTYDSTFKRRPTQVRLAKVKDENGNDVNPVIAYTAYERRGWGGLVYLDSVYVDLKDPRNNWTRFLLNRWGQVRKTWDSIGVLARTNYSPDGFVRWAEGKAADSSRVYSRYDNQWRLAKTYIIRASGDTLRKDSLVYDANHWVISRIDARGKRDSAVYDAQGRVIRTITANNDTTKFWYRIDGLLDSTRSPGSVSTTSTRSFKYHATWKNVVSVRNGTTLADTITIDALGRDSLRSSKVRVQVTAGPITKYQWRQVQPFFNVAGQTDSSRTVRTDNCNSPCNTPSWPGSLDTDSVHVQRVRHRFDRAGRDSLRLNDRNKAVLYLYDRLGRVLSRRPWTDSMTVKDSFLYDVAGNLKKTITRRGDIITTDYDSRNRDTLTVIPGVGTLRKTFGGPLDQLTRLWYDSPVDSIGNVNAELRWRFDQRGRLKADTSYTGATVRATTYTYDTYERPSSLTDPLGAWTMRYETTRGLVDTLISPYADTVTYTYDAQSRPVGPNIKSAGSRFNRTPTWNTVRHAATLSNTALVAPSYNAGYWDRNDVSEPDDPEAELGPVWTEQHGSGAGLDSLRDSITYDGWERLIAWVQRKNGTLVARDTFNFDRVGNIKTTAGAESYDATTDRLLSMSVGGITWSFRYDRAGNLDRLIKSGSNDTLTYTYDALNRLRSVRKNGVLGPISRYGYDVQGRRITKRVYSGATGGTLAYTRFAYHGPRVAFETDSIASTITLRYEWGLNIDDLIAIRDGSGNHFYVVQDKLRSVRGLVKLDGSWVVSQRFGAYGTLIAKDSSGSGPGFAMRYGWTGREYDPETGWYFHRARYYDPNVRRFVQEDPIGYEGGPNLYAYVRGGPLERVDPFGTDDMPDPAVCTKVDEHNTICVGGGATSLAAVQAMGEASDPYTRNVASYYVSYLMAMGAYSRIASSPGVFFSGGKVGPYNPRSSVLGTGLVGNVFVGNGFTGALGQYTLPNGSIGSYLRVGFGLGGDVSGGSETIVAESWDAFTDWSTEYSFGLGPANGGFSENHAGSSLFGGLAFGPTEVTGSAHYAWTYTFTTPARPPVHLCVSSFCEP